MKKVIMVATVASMIGQFNMSNIHLLQNMGCEVHVACNFKDTSAWSGERVQDFLKELRNSGIVYHQIEFPRSPFKIRKVIQSYRELNFLFKKEKFDLVHCHTPVAGVLSRIIAHRSKVKTIYTAHGFHFFKGAPKINWIIYYPIEKFFSKWTNTLITINQEDYHRARKFHAENVKYIHGVGVDTKKFGSLSIDKEKKRI